MSISGLILVSRFGEAALDLSLASVKESRGLFEELRDLVFVTDDSARFECSKSRF